MSSDNKNKNTGFEIPSNYFDGMADRMINKVNSQARDSSGFKVPDLYFDELTDKVMHCIADEKLETKVINLEPKKEVQTTPSWVIPLLSVAAIGILFFSLQNLWAGDTASFDDLGDDEIMNYVMNIEEGMDQEAVDLLFYDNDILDEITIDTQIQDDDLLEYLMEEVDLNQIYTQ